jgi:pimeloyl-[acyl-carrier protein] methyl ester esterase
MNLASLHAIFGMLPKQWVFLRGLAREKRHWGDFPEFFQAQFPDVKIAAVDFPGLGDFAHISSPTSIEGIAEFTWSEMRKHFPDGKVTVLAVSMGGMVAMDWLRTHEKDIEAAILINSSSKDSAFFYRLRYQIWPEFLQATVKTQPKEREKQVIDMIMNSEVAREKALPCWTKVAQDHPIQPLTFVRQLWAASQFSGLQKKPSTPVLLLNSLGDRFVDPSCSEALHQKFKWQLERHPWGGHDLVWDDPQWVTDYIGRFFS